MKTIQKFLFIIFQKDEGAEAIVLGCTDIPVLIQQEDTSIKLFDSVEIYAEATVKFAYS